MTTLTIYHNPRCSKSRQALELLQIQGKQPQIVEYLKTPLREAELQELALQLGQPVLTMMRTKEPVFAELGLDKDSSEKALLQAMAAHPILLERPLVSNGKKAAIGRPPENILALL